MINDSVKLTDEEKEYFMKEALLEAKKAEIMREVPIGAVVVLENTLRTRQLMLK
jgi:tRNA(adenine34) deaminase